MCFRMFDYRCVSESGQRINAIFQAALADTSAPLATRQFIAAETLERWPRSLLLFQAKDQLPIAANELEQFLQKNVVPPHNSIQANITLANAALIRSDVDKAARFAQNGWLFFLSSPNTSDRDFIRFLADFVQLFRATGQTNRASYAIAIAEQPLRLAEKVFVYDFIQSASATHDVYSDFGSSSAAVDIARRALRILESVELDESIRRPTRNSFLTTLAADCALVSTQDCFTHAEATELLNEVLASRDRASASKDHWWGGEAAVALALHLAIHKKFFPEDLQAVLQIAPAEGESNDAMWRAAIYRSGRMFMALSTAPSEAKAYAIAAVKTELARLHKLQIANPFEAVPANQYTRVILSSALVILAGSELRAPEEDEMVFEIVANLTRGRRNVESDYLFLLARANNELDASSLQVLHRLRDNLARAEKEALADQVKMRMSRGIGQPLPPFSVSRLNNFAQLADLIADHDEARRRASGTISATGGLLPILRGVLGPNERFITHSLLFNDFARVCVGPDSLAVEVVPMDAQQMVTDIKLLQAALTNPSPPSVEVDSSYPLVAAWHVSAQVFGRGATCVGKGDHLIVAPGLLELTTIPYQALVDPAKATSAPPPAGVSLAEIPWLGLHRALSTVVDAKQLIASRKLRGETLYGSAFLGIGDPRLHGVTSDGQARQAVALRGAVQSGMLLTQLDELPDTANELSRLRAIFGPSAEVLIGEDATELRLREHFLRDYRVLSFATHGLVREELTGLREPALVLTPVDSRAQVDDGLLTATEIANLDVTADLVILSACNSARYDLDLFGPQAASLSNAFFLAGARSTLASLWSVNSNATARLMVLFAEEYAKSPAPGASTALQVATRRFIESAPSTEYWHPRFWAAFAVYGDGGQPRGNSTQTQPPIRFDQWQADQRQRGEALSIVPTAEGAYVSSYIQTDAPRVIGQLRYFDSMGHPRWEIREPKRGFLLPRGSQSGDLTLVAWNYVVGERTNIEFRRYAESGELLRQSTIRGLKEELIGSLISLDGRRFVLASVVSAADSKEAKIVVRTVSDQGTELETRELDAPNWLFSPSVNLFSGREGIRLAVSGDEKGAQSANKLTSIGIHDICTGGKGTELISLTSDLQPTGKSTRFEHRVVEDFVQLDASREVYAVSAGDGCHSYASRAQLMILETGAEAEFKEIPVGGFSSQARRLVTDGDGGLLLIGQVHRYADYFHSIETPDAFASANDVDRLRRESPLRQWQGFASRFGSDLKVPNTQIFHTGSSLFFGDVAAWHGDWLVVGFNGTSQLLGTVALSNAQSSKH